MTYLHLHGLRLAGYCILSLSDIAGSHVRFKGGQGWGRERGRGGGGEREEEGVCVCGVSEEAPSLAAVTSLVSLAMTRQAASCW